MCGCLVVRKSWFSPPLAHLVKERRNKAVAAQNKDYSSCSGHCQETFSFSPHVSPRPPGRGHRCWVLVHKSSSSSSRSAIMEDGSVRLGGSGLALRHLAAPSTSPRNPWLALVTGREQRSRCLCGKPAAPDICPAVGGVCVHRQPWGSLGGRGRQPEASITSNLTTGEMG